MKAQPLITSGGVLNIANQAYCQNTTADVLASKYESKNWQ